MLLQGCLLTITTIAFSCIGAHHVVLGSRPAVYMKGRHTNGVQNSSPEINVTFLMREMFSFLSACLRKCVRFGSRVISYSVVLFLLFFSVSYCTNMHYFVPRDTKWYEYLIIKYNIMESGTQYYPSRGLVCTESESVSPAQIGTLSILGAEPHHLTQPHCHWCSKCFISTGAYSLRVDHVGCLHFITSYMLLWNTCEIMKKANTAVILFRADKRFSCIAAAAAAIS